MSSVRPLALLTALPLLAAGCALLADTGPRQTSQRSIADVSGVRLQTSGTLSITHGETTSLSVTAGRNVIDRLTSEVDDGVLVLALDGHVEYLGSVSYALVVPELDRLEVAGSGDVAARDLRSNALSITIEGSGGVTLSGLDVEQFDVTVAGSGTVQAGGSATRQDVRIQGSGDYDADRLDSRQAQVTVSGAGNASVRATDSLDAVVNGSGDIRYTGDPRVSRRIEGSGDISQKR